MKNIFLIIIAIILITSCGNSPYVPDPKIHYINHDFIIRDKWISGRYSYHYILISPSGENQVATEYSIESEKYWNLNKGDIVHFDYILKDRFFGIKNYKSED